LFKVFLLFIDWHFKDIRAEKEKTELENKSKTTNFDIVERAADKSGGDSDRQVQSENPEMD